ncbi:hypothetical protein HUU40_25930, partial [candidate division KSB1 bacterium]|nr:hypothetical protein [candidate division KSB1 bacterium]
EACLREYPQFRTQLEPLLRLAQDLGKLPQPQPRPQALLSTLVKVGRISVQQRREMLRRKAFNWGFLTPRPAWSMAFAVVLIVAFLGWGAVTVASDSLPGDLLYPLKLTTEKVKFFLTINPEGKAELRLTFAEKRLQELARSLNKGKGFDQDVLKSMLDEAELALDDAQPLPRDRASLFVARLNHFNAYQREALAELRLQIHPSQRELVDQAIDICDNRSRWMEQMRQQRSYRWQWGPGCSWEW